MTMTTETEVARCFLCGHTGELRAVVANPSPRFGHMCVDNDACMKRIHGTAPDAKGDVFVEMEGS